MKMLPKIFSQLSIMLLLTCDQLIRALSASAINSQNSDKNSKPLESVVEYYKDHEVTEKQARESLRLMKSDEEFKPPAHCKPCTNEQQQYCRSNNLLRDHCCCNQSHRKDPLYFIPHECYINNDQRCHPSLGSCLTVMYIRSCCCDSQLKKHWKSVLASGRMNISSGCHWILVSILLLISSFYFR